MDDPEDEPTTQTPEPDLPLSMSTSTLLQPSNLPTSTASALKTTLETLSSQPPQKVTIRFQPLPGAPPPGPKWTAVKVSANQNFGSIVSFLRKKLGLSTGAGTGQGGSAVVAGGDGAAAKGVGLFVYVNKVFAPGLDEGVGGLWRCFAVEGELKVSYSLAPAFG